MSEYFYNNKLDIERFSYENFVEWQEDTFDIYNSSILNEIPALVEVGKYDVQHNEGRIDLISYEIFGDVKFWWMLLEYNGIIDQSEIKTGDVIRYFSLNALETLLHRLVVKENVVKLGRIEED